MSSRKAARMMQPARQIEAMLPGSQVPTVLGGGRFINRNPWA